jgi:hypothetical protein
MSALRPFTLFAVCFALAAFAARVVAAGIGPDSFGYSAASTGAFAFTNITNGTRILVLVDDTPVTVNLGFNFNFYGSNYATVSISPNGLLTFGGTSADFNNVNLSSSVAPSNNLPCIAVLWDDWETQSIGSDAIYHRTSGTPGSRQFAVQWNKVIPVNGAGVDPVTFQARLFEGSNTILFSYADTVVADDPGYSHGAGATVGIRDRDGHLNGRHLLWSHNQAVIANGLNLLFTRPNEPPAAGDDTTMTLEDVPVTISAVANDHDPDGTLLTITAATPATNGLVSINGGTNLTYRPNPNFHGTDGFSYTIADGQGGQATARVQITVLPVNDPPRATSEVFVTHQDVPLGLSAAVLTTNDTDPDGDPLTLTGVATMGYAGGSVILSNGMITYVPPADFIGADTFDYTISDGQGGTALALVTINVWPPVEIVEVSYATNTAFVRCRGIPFQPYQIDSSSNLTDWHAATNCQADANGDFLLRRSPAVGTAREFFRARQSW